MDEYLDRITPVMGDPTYSLLKAHLLFEELLHAYLLRALPNGTALAGARLTFVQLLAVARASSRVPPPEHWAWKAVSDLNKLRNLLAHNARPKAFGERMNAYVRFVIENLKVPFPKAAATATSTSSDSNSPRHGYAPVDVATFGLYCCFAALLDVDVAAFSPSKRKQMADGVNEAPQESGQ